MYFIWDLLGEETRGVGAIDWETFVKVDIVNEQIIRVKARKMVIRLKSHKVGDKCGISKRKRRNLHLLINS